ncbi:MAG: type II secretion system protein [Gemmatimonadota bacterium]
MALSNPPSRHRVGFTLLELCLVLSFVGVAWSVLLPAARRQRDRMAVLGAREELLALLHRTRAEAVTRGGAELTLSTQPARASVVAWGDTVARAELGKIHGVTLELSRGRVETSLAYGPLGLGRVASQTVTLRRGKTEALLVVSSLGRAVRR